MSETTAISMSERLVLVAPGLFLCSVVAAAARFLSEHYGAPQMLFALLLGMALHFLMDDPRSATGIDFAARSVLRLGVALLGVRITFDQVGHLGGSAVLWMAGGVALTIGFGALAAGTLFCAVLACERHGLRWLGNGLLIVVLGGAMGEMLLDANEHRVRQQERLVSNSQVEHVQRYRRRTSTHLSLSAHKCHPKSFLVFHPAQ